MWLHYCETIFSHVGPEKNDVVKLVKLTIYYFFSLVLLFLADFPVLLFIFIVTKGMNTLIGYDLVPEAKILDSALRACRRLNDLASAIRILEAVKVSDCHLFGSLI